MTADPNVAAGTEEASDPRLVRLASLLQIEADLRDVADRDEIQFIAANETHRLLPYEQAIVWTRGGARGPKVSAISGVPVPDPRAPFVVWANRLVGALLKTENPATPHVIDPASLPKKVAAEWEEWTPGHVIWCPFKPRDGSVDAGVILLRPEPFADGDVNLIRRLSDAYGFAWWALDPRGCGRRPANGRSRGRWVSLTALILVGAAMFMPIRQSALAPAEITPLEPLVVTAPIDGVIETLHVKPNDPVKEGAALITFDRTSLRNRASVAEKAVAVAQADFQRARQKAFSDPRSKAEVALLAAEVAQKQAELNYSQELLKRAVVTAGRSGIAIYADPSDWLGKPMRLGEKVMAIADPTALELTVWVPVNDAISLKPGAEVLLFLDTDPLNPVKAELVRAAYEAELTSTKVLAYRVKAKLVDNASIPRIGLQGTAKVYGEKVSLFLFIMRRPIAALRRTVGF
ncbi:MAG: HlyD family efflux transporter periplasmic adaptor subunit [Alphaproteobacteria bacterium]|nr:HlyD family efflux transporter periplasmic adaptor subunit [Alphaproteobacteria bacterium]